MACETMNELRDALPCADSRDSTWRGKWLVQVLSTPGWDVISALAAADGIVIDEVGYGGVRSWIVPRMGDLLRKGHSLPSQWAMRPSDWVEKLMDTAPAADGSATTLIESEVAPRYLRKELRELIGCGESCFRRMVALAGVPPLGPGRSTKRLTSPQTVKILTAFIDKGGDADFKQAAEKLLAKEPARKPRVNS